ncbi:pesticin C-terminus-like muramidase [Elstera cyanobacteriorum]|uniref:pesticin C-terminus-like muramidase n=1 Tax=Elstera cyanobacteriorum TaxID=2022747 RepID=UPI002352FFD0|nr:pesticin C-terminus-like muramidase [Elstera cyanobacteriorum]MCK6443156.1 pesticin C-terminus-like muramidase [Elstera cyanobacteriorum]
MTATKEASAGTLDRIEAMAAAFLTGKTARLLGYSPDEADAWLINGRAAGLRTEAGLVHAAHLQGRVAEMRRDALAERAVTTDPARLTQIDRRITQIYNAQIALEAKLQDPRLSEEQRIADVYHLVRPLLDQRGIDLLDTTDTRISHACSWFVYNNIIRICGGTRGCVGSQRHRAFPRPLSDAINHNLGTNIDFVAYAEWEHGQELDGYVPWYQEAAQNASGVTIGTGNNLAAADLNNMRDFARLYAAQMPEPPGLIQKIAPYVGLRKQAACNFLSDHPLSLTIPEVEWLDAWRFNYTLNSSYLYDPPKPLPPVGYKSFAAAYDTVRLQKIQTGQISRHPPDNQSVLTPFKQLPMREQTILFSRLSHNPSQGIGAGNLDLLVSRDWDKIWAFYADKLKGAYKRRYKQENDYFNSQPA